MILATTEPRCAGTPCDECQSCERRISMPRQWPVWLTMIVPPIKRPCVWRIATEEETSE